MAARSGVFEILSGGWRRAVSLRCEGHSEIPGAHLTFLESLPLHRIIDDFLFVHGGIDCTLPDPFSWRGRQQMLWDRSRIICSSKLGRRRVVSGHTTRKLGDIQKSLSCDHISIDNARIPAGLRREGEPLLCGPEFVRVVRVGECRRDLVRGRRRHDNAESYCSSA